MRVKYKIVLRRYPYELPYSKVGTYWKMPHYLYSPIPRCRNRCTYHQSLQHWLQLGVRQYPAWGWCQLGRPYPILQWNGLFEQVTIMPLLNASAELLHNGESMCSAFHLYLHPTPWTKYYGYLRLCEIHATIYFKYWITSLPTTPTLFLPVNGIPYFLLLGSEAELRWSVLMDHGEVIVRGLDWESGKRKGDGILPCNP